MGLLLLDFYKNQVLFILRYNNLLLCCPSPVGQSAGLPVLISRFCASLRTCLIG